MRDYRSIDNKDFSDFSLAFDRFIRYALLYIAAAFRRHFLSAVIVFVLIAGGGILVSSLKSRQPVYVSDMVCMHNSLTRKAIGEMIQKLDMLARTHSYQTLADTLHLPVPLAQQILSIEGKNISGSQLYEDVSPGNKSPVYITLAATDRKVFAPFQAALISYFNANPYQALRNHLELERADKKTKFLAHDLHQLDSVLSSYPAYLRSTKIMADSTGGLSNMTGLFAYKDALEDKLLKTEESKSFMQSVEVLHGFLPPDKPSAPARPIGLIILAALAASLLWVLAINALRDGHSAGKTA